MKKITEGKNTLIGDNFNAHHPLWDTRAAEDDRGAALEEWMQESGWLVLNDGAPTRYTRKEHVRSGNGRSNKRQILNTKKRRIGQH